MRPVKIKLEPKIWIESLNKLPWKSPKMIGGALAVLLALGGGGYYLNTTAPAAYVVINGETVGIVESVNNGEKLLEQVLDEEGAPVGEVAKTHDQIEYTTARIDNGYTPLTKEELKGKLSFFIEAVELKIADHPMFTLASQAEADKLLKAYEEMYVKEDENNKLTAVTFEEEVEIQDVEALPEAITTVAEALEVLKQGNVQKEEYVVEENDSWWLIARKNDLKTVEVLAANPGATLDTIIKPGEKIAIEKVSPYLTVVFEGTKTATETIPFDVETKVDNKLASGTSKVTKAGADGEKVVTYSYVQKNDKIVTKTIVDEKVTKEAVSQVVTKGPQRVQVASASRGSGLVPALVRPYGGYVSSYYGYRGSEFHTGIDYAGSSGDPFVAAAAGTVVAAGRQGNYGNCILVDHGNGIQTRYAHASKILVKVGQSVSQGETIGLVGSTGRSTGSHLHFEIIVNGDTVNPANYVR
ncbi:murein DD-endopeptidase MepM/ murein hydrolase activator NlpD [Desulfitobacterium sp. LBE]|uniref:LysM domain protein n=2 Tax=Desulfitobacterium hafniense TaxID=49338 RepID=A0A098B6G5_DESHA|nr:MULTISPECIES: M23 family metallopeptidase [Desulfitobacterium]ACL19197.1 Peptidase M23 [Desulfitobacterium hafniense DCB-2]TWH57903.1 murein DD-endopeptidase MepM/ murein hydrolase activator NlpD [Desulfitobacterium sp. LBE]CDX04429.1 LysM domain protein [Desulfitobacterium hafniense]